MGWRGIFDGPGEYRNLPFYFRNNTHIRAHGAVYEDRRGFAEVDILRALQSVVFATFIDHFAASTIVEYGCGTGSNIEFLMKIFPDYEFFGADWTSSSIRNVARRGILSNERLFIVNYFDRTSFQSPPRSFIAFTNASLEQTGAHFEPFLDYLISNELCVGGIHIEPMRELLDLTNPLNVQSYKYAELRGYLTDFSKVIKTKEVDVQLSHDFGIGSKLMSGYQVVVWSKR